MKAARKTEAGRKSDASGRLAERAAALILACKGYRILSRRWRAPGGEIDILARKAETLVVVEVKKRGDEMAAAEALSPPQRQRLIAAGEAALARHGSWAKDLRFDVVLFAPGRLPRHIKNAFDS